VAVVHPLPSVQQPDPLVICDVDSNGFGIFDLDSATPQIIDGDPSLVVTYHETITDAEDGLFPLANPYQNIVPYQQTVYVRVEDPITGCFVLLDLDLLVNPLPSAQQPDPLVACDVNGNGVGSFDLNVATSQITNNDPDLIVTYYLTQSDAEGGINPLPSPYQNTTNPETLYVRVEDISTGCFVILELALVVHPLPDMDQLPQDLFSNDGDSNGIATFDLTVNEPLMLGTQNPADFEFTYYESYSTNPIIITNPTAYQNISNPQTIYVTMADLNTDCFAVADFEIEASVLSLDSNDFNPNVVLYPNPSDGQVNILMEPQVSYSVEVYTILGKKVSTSAAPINLESGTVDLSGLSTGTYFIKITTNTLQIVKSVIKK
jgi:large repetitive protein